MRVKNWNSANGISCIVFGCLALVALLIMGCSAFSHQRPTENATIVKTSSVDEEKDQDVKIPRGNEVGLKVRLLGNRRAEVTVTNKSSETVFLPYWPGGMDKRALNSAHLIERLDEPSGRFERLEGGHLSTGLHPLAPGDFYRVEHVYPEKGTYRIVIYYMTDESLATEANNWNGNSDEERMNNDEHISRRYDLARRMVISKPFKL